MGIVAVILRMARQIFVYAAVALILFFLPIEVLFHISSWSLFMSVPDMVYETLMMILLLALVSAGVALPIAGIGGVLVMLPFRKAAEKIEQAICAVVAIAILALIVLYLLRTLKLWLQMVTGTIYVVGTAKFVVLLSIIGIFVVCIWKYGLLATGNAIRSRLARGTKVVLIAIISAGLAVAANGIELHDYDAIEPNPLPSPRAGMPNVILLSIDTLAAGDMSLYGYHLPTTPRLEAFAKESYVFDNFFASSNWTTPSIASIMSGLHPSTSGAQQLSSYFLDDDEEKNLGQILKDNGYHTAAIVANINAHPLSLQISDGFSGTTERPVRNLFVTDPIFEELLRLKDYRTYWWVTSMLEGAFRALLNFLDEEDSLWPPQLVFDRALPFFGAMKQPNFVWAHINPPHGPYLPAAPFKYKFGNFKAFSRVNDYGLLKGEYSPEQQALVDQQRLRYDEFIVDTDSRVGDFLDKLKAMGRFDDSIIIILSDHGESFTKNFLGHSGPFLHQPLIHVPLIIRLPGQKEGRRIPFYAGHVDLLPTVMDLLDLPIPKWVEGETLEAVMLEGKPTVLPKFSMNLDQDSRFAPPSRGTFAVMQDGWKLVRYLATGKEELYHLASDPGETTDLTIRNPGKAKTMRDLIYARFKPAN